MEENKKNNSNELLSLFTFLGILFLFIGLSFLNLYTIRYKFDGTNYYTSLSYFNVIFKGNIDLIFNETTLSKVVGIDFLGFLFFIFLIISSLCYLVFKVFKITLKKDIDILVIISSILLSLCLILFIVEPYTYNLIHNCDSLFNEFNFKEVGVEGTTFAFLLIFIFILFILSIKEIKKNNSELFNVKSLSEMAMMVALAIVLDKLKIGIGATGGSINLSMLPLLIYSYRHGFIKGLFASSIVFGILTNLIDGYGIITYPFDYLIAFSGYSLPGLFKILFNKLFKDNEVKSMIFNFVSSCILAFIIRMIGSTLSSMILYEYELNAALLYNVLYIGPSCAICLVGSLLLIQPIILINNKFPVKK